MIRIIPLKIESEAKAKRLLASIGVSRQGVKILAPKSLPLAFRIDGISSVEANIIKQNLLSLGTDSAIEKDALIKRIKTKTIIFGSLNQLKRLCKKLNNQPFGLREVSTEISTCLNNLFKKEFIFKARDKVLKIKEAVICGIINLTPDSFSQDGLLKEMQNARQSAERAGKMKSLVLKKAGEMIKNGAKIIDLGGESTRPFSRAIKEEEEIRRVMPALKAIRKEFKKIIISLDTYKYKVAKVGAEEGVDIINDITAFNHSPRMASLIKNYKLGCVLMHMKGSPATMQVNPSYTDVVEEIIDFFGERLKFFKGEGLTNEQIVIDPGIGFGKRLEDNIKIINELYKFKIFGLPLFLGLSRKSFIAGVLNVPVGERLTGTIAASCCALIKGANILRVHDTKEIREAVKITSNIFNN